MEVKRLSAVKQRCKYVACDYATGVVAFFLFNILRCLLLHKGIDVGTFIFQRKLMIEALTVPLGMLGIYWLSGYYNLPFGKSRLQELITTFFSSLINTGLIYFVLLINDQTGERFLNYELLGGLELLMFIVPYLGRFVVTSEATKHFRAHLWEFRTLIVGSSAAARETARRLSNGNTRAWVRIVGFLSIPGEENHADSDDVFPFEEIEALCRKEKIDQIVIAGSSYDEEKILHMLYKLYLLGIPVKIAPDTFSYVTSAIRLQDIYGEPYVDLTSPALSESAKNVKRLADVIFSALILVIFSPFYLILALLVKLDSNGSVIYSQERIGRMQRPFKIYKFRTMRSDAETSGPQLSEENDPRVTRVGKVLRKYRLDELPQFWNVLKGEMSIVGPRPERRYFIERIMRSAPYHALVYQVRPGITSWGMVKYGYASTVEQMVERTRYDLIYISNMSLYVDLKILIYTIKTVITGKGL
ncbi:MAG: sugar transferase [Bacteroides sp.]|nr:sugar transferase [Bacteroides sp.]